MLIRIIIDYRWKIKRNTFFILTFTYSRKKYQAEMILYLLTVFNVS